LRVGSNPIAQGYTNLHECRVGSGSRKFYLPTLMTEPLARPDP